MSDISRPTPNIQSSHAVWKRNRDALAGRDAIIAAGEAYLDKHLSQTAEEYRRYLRNADWFPAAARTLEGHIGLVFRKDPVLTGGENYSDILDTITQSLTLPQLAKLLLKETMTTNFSVILTDSPAMPVGLSKAEAVAEGYRPFLAFYAAESILEVSTSIVRNRRVISLVRLMDDADTVRVLSLENGIYGVTLHHRVGDQWIAGETITPLKNGATMTSIPIEIVNTDGSFTPTSSVLDEVVNTNFAHYRHQADQNNVLRYCGNPVRYINNMGELQSDLSVGVAEIWQFTGDTRVFISEHSGSALKDLRDAVQDKVNELAAIGSRILQSDKAAAEAAETLAIRRASENSLLAGITNAVSDRLTAALNSVMDWIDAPAVTYRLNTDFLPTPMGADELTTRLALVQAGRMADETFFDVMKEGEVIPAGLTYEEEKARRAADTVDAPPVTA
ncbi:MAG: DUF4055 domain-containing protein [Sphingobium sp.]